MKQKTWIKYWFSSSLLIAILIVSFNYLIDPYGIFGIKLPYNINKNKTNIAIDRMSKFYYFKRKKPEVLLIGSSRMAVFKPKDLKAYVNKNIYNFSMGSCTIYELYEHIKFAIKYTSIKQIILGVDLYTFNPERFLYDSESMKRFSLERLTKKIYYKDYFESLFTFDTFQRSIFTMLNNILGKIPQYDLENGTDTWYPQLENEKYNGDKAIFKSIVSTLVQYSLDKEYYNSEKFQNIHSIDMGMNYFKKIIELCKENDIDLKVMISPLFYKHYDLIIAKKLDKTFNHLKKEMVKYHDVYDFSFPSEITKNYKNFLDSSHIKKEIGKTIFKRIFDEQDINFGLKLTKINVDSIIAEYEKRQKNLNLTKLHQDLIINSIDELNEI